MAGVIETVNLVKRFGDVVAVDDVSISVEDGELFGFLGPNGAGKTTTINILTTLMRPTSGRAVVGGYDVVENPNEVRRIVGVVPQELTVDEDLTGWENLMLQGGLYHLSSAARRQRAEELLELVGLSDAKHRRVETYSGGMQKRLELACGLMHRPKVLFLDEPTLGLDVHTRSAIWEYIRRLRDELNITIFLTTHYLEEADALCNRVAIIDKGRVMVTGTPSELKVRVGGDIIELETFNGHEGLVHALKEIDGVKRVISRDRAYHLTVERGEEVLPTILEAFVRLGVKVTKVTMKRPTLDEVFLEYTGRQLRQESSDWEDKLKSRFTIRRIRS
ncbi:MAG: ATP-binding cassette domain-containing protein [Aigarchaeota archaeon]|nr:ATP-binding cassette domain-containing protein [Aigarchaeota archaeon]MDW8092294.1 ATP-binding cassette domain-containing protein [Nitrososphaerota archaeon]